MFSQVHQPGVAAQSDFTHMTDLAVTLGGLPFPHLAFHLVLTYSNVEAVTLCLSETFEALAEGIEACLWQLGGVPQQHRTDHLSAAIRPLDAEGRAQATQRYAALMAHYGLAATTNNAGIAHENGDVEQAHYRFKQAVDQALRVRGSRDFPTRAAYLHFLQDLVRRRNLTRQVRWVEEQPALRPLPRRPLSPYRELRVVTTPFSTLRVLRNTYSVPSRLIGRTVTVRVRSETVEVYLGTAQLLTMPRLLGENQHRIDYRHVIWSLVRKPGAFAHYRYRDELFPRLAFRAAYDALQRATPARADREYVRVLHLAASTSETEVEAALHLGGARHLVPTLIRCASWSATRPAGAGSSPPHSWTSASTSPCSRVGLTMPEARPSTQTPWIGTPSCRRCCTPSSSPPWRIPSASCAPGGPGPPHARSLPL
jgi:hypothetical protein